MAGSTWDEREALILDAVNRASEDGTDPNPAARGAVAGVDDRVYGETVAALMDAGHLAGICQRNAGGEVSVLFIERLTHRGLEAVGRWRSDLATVEGADSGTSDRPGDARRVFLVQGRNQGAADAVSDLLASAGLLVIGWEEAVRAAGGGSPYTLDIVRAGMQLARAVVVLFTPDDIACLDPRLVRTSSADEEDTVLVGRARQNVVLEAGMALAFDDTRTVLVEIGRVAGLSDLAGKHVVRLDGTPPRRKALLQRLRDMGCDVNMDGERWMFSGDFSAAVFPFAAFELVASTAATKETTPERAAGSPVLARVSALDTFHPTGRSTPAGRTVDLHLRCGVVLPSAVGGPAVAEEVLSRTTGEHRETELADLLDASELTNWLRQQQQPFHLGDIPGWHPTGYNAGDISELAVEPYDDGGALGPVAAVCSVTTGWMTEAGSARLRPGIRVIADVMLRVLEYDEQRRPSPTRHATTPPPAPAALSLQELLDVLAATMSVADTASAGFMHLLEGDAPADGLLVCWLSTPGSSLDRVVDLTDFRAIPNAGSGTEGRIRKELPLAPDAVSLVPPNARRDAAKELLSDILERAGRRGYTEHLRSL